MSDITLEYKINLRNKYLNKIIKNFKEVNNSLELLNNVNQKINRQYGGTVTEAFNKTQTKIDEMDSEITKIKGEVDVQIAALTKASDELTATLTLLGNNVSKIPANKSDLTVNTALINTEIDKLPNTILNR